MSIVCVLSCQKADLILPNLTEACLLAEVAYEDKALTEEFLQLLTQRLATVVGTRRIVLTGLPLSDDQIGVAYFDKEEGFQLFSGKRFPQQFFGTGDMLTALLSSAYLQGLDLKKVIPMSMSVIEKCLETTLRSQEDIRYGVFYQPHLGDLFAEFKQLLEVSNEK